MNVRILYYQDSESARSVDEYIQDYDRRYNVELQIVDMSTRAGADLAALYDIVRYPALIATDEQGGLAWLWQEESLPLKTEVRAYQISV